MHTMNPTDAGGDGHPLRTPLGAAGWDLWGDAALRSAGFPAERITELCDAELASAADQFDEREEGSRERYAKVFEAAAERLSAVVRRTAADPGFREAVTWQNPALIHNCLDKAAAGEPRNVRGRYHEQTIVTYLQRYCLKNDTVGFFGPVGWAEISPEATGLSATPGPALVGRRTTYFEGWAVEAVARTIGARREVLPWLTPRVVPSTSLTGWTVQLPFRKPVTLTAQEVRVLGQCDGRHTVGDIAGTPFDLDTVTALLRLRDLEVIRIDLAGGLVAEPERDLADRIARLGDPAVRQRAEQPLDELVAARAEVAASAGDPDRLLRATRHLAAEFERLTTSSSTRRAGGTYAGRTLVYEDTVRDLDLRIGRDVTDRLAAPLGLLLDSALWLANSIAERYLARARRVLDRELERSGAEAMPLLQMLTALLPEVARPSTDNLRSELVDEVVAEFRERWRRVVDLPLESFADTRRYAVGAAEIADRVAREFATGAPLWSCARWNSPDIMFMTESPEAAERGDVDFVLGEMHCSINTLESQLFVSQHPDSARLRDSAAASGMDSRVTIIPRMDAALTTSRMARATELRLPAYTYLSIGSDSFDAPQGATTLSVADLMVERKGDDGLLVRHRTDGREYPFLELIGEPLSLLVANAFSPFGGASHRPRISIDRLVVEREAWTFQAADCDWAFIKDERRRYAAARAWRARHHLPERGFYRVPVERKPMAVDFRSLALVNLLAKSVRRTAEAGAGGFTLSEMLPDADRLWLRDHAGQQYTAELRVVAVDAARR
ncbi:lantibiotic dehydratase family protein [Streptomyces sp. NBC_01221]|uniref:lantibiotic dehydratase n=1 Tax=Streptomyces sp. NBC_01221 TaxID=2903782 RepID=UPI002253AB84|nr:lantibiotic dehydratase [Streptomyces sp. NBC_01221]MCX4791432.1 lantibiotic dehydratase family protein [Streptomyces sp. NBC_01221]